MDPLASTTNSTRLPSRPSRTCQRRSPARTRTRPPEAGPAAAAGTETVAPARGSQTAPGPAPGTPLAPWSRTAPGAGPAPSPEAEDTAEAEVATVGRSEERRVGKECRSR